MDRGADLFLDGSGVADTGRATVPHEVEPKRVQIFLQPRSLKIVRNNLRPRCERRLDPGFDLQSERPRLSRNQSGPDHDIGVRRVGA